jgi:hypothetical protein
VIKCPNCINEKCACADSPTYNNPCPVINMQDVCRYNPIRYYCPACGKLLTLAAMGAEDTILGHCDMCVSGVDADWEITIDNAGRLIHIKEYYWG